MAVPTAASMDGYAASGAALRDGGFKRTFACAAAGGGRRGSRRDRAAPPAMAGWGYGDLVGKLVAGADWLLADAIGEDAINPVPFAMVQDNLARWLGDPAGLRRGDRAALGGLMRGLARGRASRCRRTAIRGRRAAATTSSRISGRWRRSRSTALPVSHGACVGVGCLSMLAAYEWLLRQDVRAVDPAARAARAASPTALGRRDRAPRFRCRFMADNAAAETAAKPASPASRRATAARAAGALARDRRRLCARACRAPRPCRGWLDAAGAPSTPSAIGIAPSQARGRLRARAADPPPLHRARPAARPRLAQRRRRALFGAGGFWAPSRAVA